MKDHITFTVKKVIKETPDSLSLILNTKNGEEINFKPGQFLTFLLEDEHGEEVRRGYSISSSPDLLPDLRVTIKEVSEGSTKRLLLDTIKEGDEIKSLPPLGNFTVNINPVNRNEYVLFGAGSGITPLISMIHSVLPNEPNSKVYLFYGNRNEESIIFENEFKELKEKFPGNFFLEHTLSKPIGDWSGLKGRITRERTIEFLAKYFGDNKLNNKDYYLCGPEEMMKSIIDLLKEKEVDSGKIHREIYTTSVLEGEDVDNVERTVTVIFEGEEHKLTVMPGDSILETAIDNGLELPNSCRFGSCGTCRAKLIAGSIKLVDQTALSDEELEEGYCLTCIGYPVNDNVIVLYEDQFE